MKISLPSSIILVFLTSIACNKPSEITSVAEATLSTKPKVEIMKPYLIHTVYFWTKEGTTEKQLKYFEQGLKKLGTCPQIQSFFWGPPASTEKRDVVDNSYTYAINVHFSSVENELAYQNEPIHLEFIENHKDIWEKVVVYDNLAR